MMTIMMVVMMMYNDDDDDDDDDDGDTDDCDDENSTRTRAGLDGDVLDKLLSVLEIHHLSFHSVIHDVHKSQLPAMALRRFQGKIREQFKSYHGHTPGIWPSPSPGEGGIWRTATYLGWGIWPPHQRVGNLIRGFDFMFRAA